MRPYPSCHCKILSPSLSCAPLNERAVRAGTGVTGEVCVAPGGAKALSKVKGEAALVPGHGHRPPVPSPGLAGHPCLQACPSPEYHECLSLGPTVTVCFYSSLLVAFTVIFHRTGPVLPREPGTGRGPTLGNSNGTNNEHWTPGLDTRLVHLLEMTSR